MNGIIENCDRLNAQKVLFVCVHNSGRSQMAEAFFNHLAEGSAIACSAGTDPGRAINPVVVEAMLEAGIDISGKKPKLLTPLMVENADITISMGCGIADVCPATFIPTIDWQLEDPEGQPLEKVRLIRDEIRAHVQTLISDIQFQHEINDSSSRGNNA